MNFGPCRPGWIGPVLAVFLTVAAVAWPGPPAVAATPGIASESASAITDETIGETVEEQLYLDQAVPSAAIDVSSTDGVVTLTGSVSNILAKEWAARIAETVKGVRSVVNAIEVQPTTARPPIEIGEDIVSALENDPATEVWEIVPTVAEGGVVTLSGTVQSWAERELAALVAKGVKGVTDLENKIAVEPAEDRPDAEIRADIERSLRWDALVDHEEIGVGVEDGAVRLAGTVGSAAEWRRARRDAFTVGVTSVDGSRLVVAEWTGDPALRDSPPEIRSEDDVIEAVRRALDVDPRVDAEKVDATIVANMVTLRGTVDSVRAKRAAAENARNTVGVNDVLNRLSVQPTGTRRTDDDLATRVRDATKRDPYLETFDIDVTVSDGVAHLEGVVDTDFAKSRAEDVAAGIRGIVEVENSLEVSRAQGGRPGTKTNG